MRTRLAGFSLAEVAIALGLLSFVLLAVVGLLGVGLKSGKEAQISTLQAAVAREVMATLGTQSFTNVTNPTNLTKFFTYDGIATNSATNAYFQCVISTNAVTDLPPDAATNLLAFKVQFIHPAFAPPAARLTNTLHATFSRQN